MKRYNIVLDSDDKIKAVILTKKQGVTFSSLMRKLLKEWLKEQ